LIEEEILIYEGEKLDDDDEDDGYAYETLG